jgi:MarR family 2-MHQ and catechol resistance regulon transcriptional repressor
MLGEEEPGTELWRLVRNIYRTALKRLNSRLSKERITFSQYNVLLALARNGPMQMNKLGENMLVTPANVSGLIERMESKKFVRRRRSRSDRRLYVIETTELGSKAFKGIYGPFHAYVRSVGNDLSGEELESTVAALKKVLETVERTKEI